MQLVVVSADLQTPVDGRVAEMIQTLLLNRQRIAEANSGRIEMHFGNGARSITIQMAENLPHVIPERSSRLEGD